MSNKTEIIILYYEQKFNIIEISNRLNVSKQYVSKIVRADPRHTLEKQNRIQQNKIKQSERFKDYMKKRRNKQKEDNSLDVLALKHAQASAELSGRKFINNRAFRNWNSSIYQFHNRTKEYRLKEEFKDKTSYAIPKKIKWY